MLCFTAPSPPAPSHCRGASQRQPPKPGRGPWAPHLGPGDGPASRGHLSLRAGLRRRGRWSRVPLQGCACQGSLACPPLPPPGSPNTYVAATPLSSRRTAPSGRGRQSPGCRVIGPFKRKLSAAGNKTLPFNSGIIRSGREPSRGKAFIEKRWENEI